MAYIPPEKVESPKRRWHHFATLLDKGAGKPAYAIGKWDQVSKVIVYRWNGDDSA